MVSIRAGGGGGGVLSSLLSIDFDISVREVKLLHLEQHALHNDT